MIRTADHRCRASVSDLGTPSAHSDSGFRYAELIASQGTGEKIAIVAPTPQVWIEPRHRLHLRRTGVQTTLFTAEPSGAADPVKTPVKPHDSHDDLVTGDESCGECSQPCERGLGSWMTGHDR